MRVANTAPMRLRRPAPRSATRDQPFSTTSAPGIGTRPSRFAIKPSTVSTPSSSALISICVNSAKSSRFMRDSTR